MPNSDKGRKYAFLIDGDQVFGYVHKITGGAIRGELATSPTKELILRKVIKSIEYEDFLVDTGMDMTRGLSRWISATFNQGYVKRSGEIHSCDSDYKSLSQHQFFTAYIAEVAMPTLDAASKELAYMTLRIRPEGVRLLAGDNKKLEVEAPNPEKEWIASNFIVEIGDLPCSRVMKVELPNLTQKVVVPSISRSIVEPSISPSIRALKVEMSNLKLKISMSDVEQWLEWGNEF